MSTSHPPALHLPTKTIQIDLMATKGSRIICHQQMSDDYSADLLDSITCFSTVSLLNSSYTKADSGHWYMAEKTVQIGQTLPH